MRIELCVSSLVADGVRGGRHETPSHVGLWFSTEEGWQPKKAPLVLVAAGTKKYKMEEGAMYGPYTIDETALRGDESFWLHLFSSTHYADVPSIDKEESTENVRNMQSGSVQIPLARILSELDKKTHTATVTSEPLMDMNYIATELFMARISGREPNLNHVYEKAQKARATFTVRVLDINDSALTAATALLVGKQTTGGVPLAMSSTARVTAFAQGAHSVFARTIPLAANSDAQFRVISNAAGSGERFSAIPPVGPIALPAPVPGGPVRNPRTGKLLYVPANFQYFVEVLDRFVSIYARQYIGALDMRTGELVGPPVYDTSIAGLKGLQFAVFRSMVGMLPVIAFWAHAPQHRPYSTEQERAAALARYGTTDITEAFYDTMLRASLRRYGLTEQDFTEAVEAQYARTDETVLEMYTVSKCAIVDVGAFVATAGYYTNDSRYPNVSRTITPEERVEAQKRADEVLADQHKHGESLDIKVAVADVHAALSCESFDQVVMFFLSRSLDCEDAGNVATSVGRLIAFGRTDRGKGGLWDSALLRAAQRVLRDHAFLDTGGDVTARFLGADGAKMEKNDIKELPLRGSPEDVRNETGGHAYGLLPSLARCAVWSKRAGLNNSALQARVRSMAPWQARQATLPIEGTGPIDHILLPAGELFGNDHPATRKAEAARHLVRDVLINDTWKPLTDTFRAYSTPFYSHTVEKNRRVTAFYLRSVHCGSVDLYMLHKGMSQFAFVNLRTKERGVDTVDILRDSLRDPADTGAPGDALIAIDFPFYAHEEAWRRDMEPVMEAMVNQLPVTALAQIGNYGAMQKLHFTLFTNERDLATCLGISSTSIVSVPPVATRPAGKQQEERIHTSDGKALEGHAFARIGAIHETMVPAVSMSTQNTELALRTPSALGMRWIDALSARDVHISGTLDWNRVKASMSALYAITLPPVVTKVGTESVVLHATVADFLSDVPLSAERANAIRASFDSPTPWSTLKNGKERWSRWLISYSPYSVRRVTLEPPRSDTLSGAILRVEIACDEARLAAQKDMRARSMSLLHVTLLDRVYALSPLVVNIGGTTPSGPYLNLTFALSAAQMAQAFCTSEVLEAQPWVVLSTDMPRAAAGASSVLSALPTMLSFDTSALAAYGESVITGCYKRNDVALVRFMARDWAVKKNWDAVIACLQKLYTEHIAIAHEFVVGTPLPQNDPIVELHLLIKA
jgi:hypothetical protein